jgi:hypothetical protein
MSSRRLQDTIFLSQSMIQPGIIQVAILLSMESSVVLSISKISQSGSSEFSESHWELTIIFRTFSNSDGDPGLQVSSLTRT